MPGSPLDDATEIDGLERRIPFLSSTYDVKDTVFILHPINVIWDVPKSIPEDDEDLVPKFNTVTVRSWSPSIHRAVDEMYELE